MPHLAVTLQREPTATGFTAGSDRWPMHATLLQSFRIDSALQAVVDVVRARAGTSSPVTVVGDHLEGFGPDRDIPVTVLGEAGPLIALHTALLADLATLQGFAPDVPDWAGDGYRPHVTAGTWGALPVGERVTFDRIAVVDLDTSDRKPVVVAIAPLGTASGGPNEAVRRTA